MEEEIRSCEEHETWTMEELPSVDMKLLNCKWVYDLKGDNEGNVVRFKARIVAKGCAQKKGMH